MKMKKKKSNSLRRYSNDYTSISESQNQVNVSLPLDKHCILLIEKQTNKQANQQRKKKKTNKRSQEQGRVYPLQRVEKQRVYQVLKLTSFRKRPQMTKAHMEARQTTKRLTKVHGPDNRKRSTRQFSMLELFLYQT